ncbi:hypothetical protein FACS1894216_11330 [Synergistales bacterium]|nr:hypothetical protein FACS1894216_11330 [Synergistales bacterium]
MEITSLEKLRECINPAEFESIIEKISGMTSDEKVIIWDASPTAARILNYLKVHSHASIIIWDNNWKRQKRLFRGHRVENPSPENCSDEIKRTAVVIVAVDAVSTFTSLSVILHACGFPLVCHGNKLLLHIGASKVMDDYLTYKRIEAEKGETVFNICDDDLLFGFGQIYDDAGAAFNGFQLNQDLWVAKKVYERRPFVHYDIGSRIDGFITHLLSFGQKTVLIDIRPLMAENVDNLTFIHEDATEMRGVPDNSIPSISSIGALEHFGIGMYGGRIDTQEDTRAFKNMQRVLCEGGDAYISIPVSQQNFLRFNTRKVYSPHYICDQFSEMELMEFAYIAHSGGLVRNASISMFDHDKTITRKWMENDASNLSDGGFYWGLFHFRKRQK